MDHPKIVGECPKKSNSENFYIGISKIIKDFCREMKINIQIYP